MKRTENNKGFTLAELLVVVAVISILLAIATPIFSAHLERARMAVDMSNARSASSMAYTEYVLCHMESSDEKKILTYTFGVDSSGNLYILEHTDESGETQSLAPLDADITEIKAQSKTLTGVSLTVTISGGRVMDNSWLSIIDEMG